MSQVKCNVIGYFEGVEVIEDEYFYCPFLEIDICLSDCLDILLVKDFLNNPDYDPLRERINQHKSNLIGICKKCGKRGDD